MAIILKDFLTWTFAYLRFLIAVTPLLRLLRREVLASFLITRLWITLILLILRQAWLLSSNLYLCFDLVKLIEWRTKELNHFWLATGKAGLLTALKQLTSQDVWPGIRCSEHCFFTSFHLLAEWTYLYLELSQIKNWLYISEILAPYLRTRVFISLSWVQILIWLITFLLSAILGDFQVVLVFFFFAQSVPNWYTICFKLVLRTTQYNHELHFTRELSTLET